MFFLNIINNAQQGDEYEKEWMKNPVYENIRKEWVVYYMKKMISILNKNDVEKKSYIYKYFFHHLNYLTNIIKIDNEYKIYVENIDDDEFDKLMIDFRKKMNYTDNKNKENSNKISDSFYLNYIGDFEKKEKNIFIQDYENAINYEKEKDRIFSLTNIVQMDKLKKYPEFVEKNAYLISNNSTVKIEDVMENHEYKWNWNNFSYHENFLPELIKEIPEMFGINPNYLNVLDINPNMTLKFILNNQDINFDWYRVLTNSKKMSETDLLFLMKNKDKIESLKTYSFNIYYFMMENRNFPIMELKNKKYIKQIVDVYLKKSKLIQLLENKRNITMDDYSVLKKLYPDENFYDSLNPNLTFDFLDKNWNQNWIHLHKLIHNDFDLERQRFIQSRMKLFFERKSKLESKFDKFMVNEIISFIY